MPSLLFAGEAALPSGGLRADPDFVTAFRANRRPDPRGRSVKDFDLQTRLFTWPCSYLICSDAFNTLPASLKQAIYRRLREVLEAADSPPPFAHLTPEIKRALRELLPATKPDLAAAWAN